MASGFLVLPDGRCLARRWRAHDTVLRWIADALAADPAASRLEAWLRRQIPGPDDIEELGFGAFLRRRNGTEEVVLKHLDLRRLAPEQQRLFCDAAKRARQVVPDDEWARVCLDDLVDMIERGERGEPPLS